MKRISTAALAISALAAPALAEEATAAKQAIVPENMEWQVDQLNFSPAVRAGDFVYLSGIVAGLPKNDDGEIAEASEENLVSAYERAFKAVAYVLEAAGASWDDVVDMTTYHTNLPGQIDAFFVVKKRWHKEPYSAWTAIDIDRLYPDNGVTEIKVVAYAPVE